MKFLSEDSNAVTYGIYRINEQDWDLFQETLEEDAESGHFDVTLREEISHALDTVEVVQDTVSRRGVIVLELRAPEDAWDTLFETLHADAESSFFDPELRQQLSRALARVQQIL